MKIPENIIPNFSNKHRITADKVLENRLKFCETLIKNNQFNTNAYASYFEIPLSRVEDDVKSLGYELSKVQGENALSYEDLNKARQKVLEKDSGKEILEKLGMWHLPREDKEKSYRYSDSDYNVRLNDALEYYQSERLFKTIGYQLVADKFSVPVNEFKDAVDKNNLKRIEHSIVDNYKEDLAELINNSTVASVSKLTGMPREIFYDLSRQLSEEYKDSHSNLMDEHMPTKSASRLEQRREAVWNMYNIYGSTHGYTQQEIADQFGLSRNTVISDIKSYKKEHPDVIDVTQLYRARHLGLEKTLSRNEKKAVAASLYTHGEAITNIAKEINTPAPMVRNYLLEEGLIDPYAASKYRDSLIREDVSNSAETGYAHKGQFLYGSTTDLLNQKNAPSPSENLMARNSIRRNILNDQHETMAALRNDPVAFNEFNTKRGRMVDFMEYNEQRKEARQLEDADMEMEM